MRKTEKRTSVKKIKNHVHIQKEIHNATSTHRATLENLAADTWSKSLKRGIYSYKIKELFGSNAPENIIKIEDLDVRLVGTINDKKLNLHNQSIDAPDTSQEPAKKNVVVISVYGPPFKCAVADELADTCLLSENLMAITLNPFVPAAYVSAYLNSSKGQKEFDKYRTGSTRFARITENNLKLFEIPLPSDEVRQSVYEWFDHLYHYELALNRERNTLSHIATGILQNIGGEPSE